VNGEVVEKKPRGATAWFENPDSGEAIHDLIETWRFAIVIGKKPEAMAPKGWRSGR